MSISTPGAASCLVADKEHLLHHLQRLYCLQYFCFHHFLILKQPFHWFVLDLKIWINCLDYQNILTPILFPYILHQNHHSYIFWDHFLSIYHLQLSHFFGEEMIQVLLGSCFSCLFSFQHPFWLYGFSFTWYLWLQRISLWWSWAWSFAWFWWTCIILWWYTFSTSSRWLWFLSSLPDPPGYPLYSTCYYSLLLKQVYNWFTPT